MATTVTSRRRQDADAALNLYPGFRFHPTDDELVHSYLLPRAAHRPIPVNIIAEIDLYKFNPWELPEKALYGHKEWYFFTPRDRKYPNGSRPNRAAANGYWKATGADKLVMPPGYGKPVGIKKALVFYHGKAPKGIKTDWIMHEYRIADTNRSATATKRSLRLDDVVLCRLYNKKNGWVMPEPEQFGGGETSESADFKSDSVWTPESEVTHGSLPEHADLDLGQSEVYPTMMAQAAKDEGNDWFMDLNLDDLQGTCMGLPPLGVSTQDCYFSQQPMGLNDDLPPF